MLEIYSIVLCCPISVQNITNKKKNLLVQNIENKYYLYDVLNDQFHFYPYLGEVIQSDSNHLKKRVFFGKK